MLMKGKSILLLERNSLQPDRGMSLRAKLGVARGDAHDSFRRLQYTDLARPIV